ncbi:MAG: DNA methyltransferase [Nannocystaceae bacterium]|nr:site-specific DNA-methyltransferase [bacterium]
MTRPRGPELVWPGKYADDGSLCDPEPSGAVLEVEEQIGRGAEPDRLLRGDNLHALDALLATHRERVDLIYIDPPFSTGGHFEVATRVGRGEARKAPPEIRAPAYTDRFEGGATGFLQMMAPRLRRMHALLAPHGSFYLHVDPTVGHMVKLLLDEVFGPGCFQREIVWRIGWVSGFKSKAKNWIRNHDLIYFYVKDPSSFTFNKKYVPYPPGYVRRDGKPPTGKGVPIDDVWNANTSEFALRGKDSLDSIQIKSFSNEKCGYATQKNESLTRRIVEASSNPGDLVLDAFCGSGTLGVAARQLGRRFIGVDASGAAVHIATKRLLDVEAPSASPVRVETVVQPDRRQRYAARLRDHLGEPESGVWTVLAGYDEAVTEARLQAWVAERPEGTSAVRVIGRRFDLGVHREDPTEVDVTLLRASEDLWNDAVVAAAEAALQELPRVGLDVMREGDLFSLVLDDYALAHPGRLDSALTEAAEEPLDFVDAWSVTWDASPLLQLQTDVMFARTHQRRTLPTRTALRPLPTAPQPIRVRIVDVLYQHTTITARLVPCPEEGVRLEDVRLR